MSIHEVIIDSEFPLSGTLTIPSNMNSKVPVVLIISGSGGANRDGNMMGFKSDRYKILSDYLNQLGYATLRYDKRGVSKSKGKAAKAGMWDLVEDVCACIDFLESSDLVDSTRIILCGHSEGCMLATLVADKKAVSAMILLSGAGTALRGHMEAQQMTFIEEVRELKGIKGFLLKRLIREKGAVEKQAKIFEKVINSNRDTFFLQGKLIPAKWIREHFSLENEDYLELLSKSQIPVLAVTGNKDVQTDYKGLVAVEELSNPNISCHVINDMDHMLTHYSGPLSILNIKKQYKGLSSKPLHDELQGVIQDFLESSTR